MASDYESQQFSSFIKGINASSSKTNQPQGSIPRGSNLLLTRRGSLIACDGSQMVHAFNGVPTAGRGRILAAYLFQPTGVPSYYMMLANAPDLHLGSPLNLTLATAAGGTLPAATYYYKVTALDGVGGETTASLEASIVTGANGKNTLTWNVVPNAFGYRVYRGTAPNGEVILTSSSLPVNQPSAGTLTASFVDDGSGSVTVITVTTASITFISSVGALRTYFANFQVPSTAGLVSGSTIVYTPGTNANFAGQWFITGIVDGQNFSASRGPVAAIPGLVIGSTTTGGTFPTGSTPIADNTQQIALFKMPVLPGAVVNLPVSYNNSNIVALFPAALRTTSSPASGGGGTGGGGSSGGSGGGGGGGTGGGSGGGGGGRPID